MMSKKVKVSVLCLTYNQKRFIKKALESIMSQKTDFEFEVLINDDSSTDGTTKILKEYERRYPEKIKVIYHNENQFTKGRRNFIARYLLPKATGEFIAICEGDDYWTDNRKLQLQVNFLQKNKNHALVFHPVKILYPDNESEIFPSKSAPDDFTINSLLKENFIQTNSVMYRKQSYEEYNINAIPGDWYLHLYHARKGKIGFINKTMAVYRRHEGGIWWDAHINIENIWRNHGVGHIVLYDEMIKLFGSNSKRKKIIQGNINTMIHNLALLYTKGNPSDKAILLTAINKYPEHVANTLAATTTDLIAMREKLTQSTEKVEELMMVAEQLKQQKNAILNSKPIRLRNFIGGFIGKKPIQ